MSTKSNGKKYWLEEPARLEDYVSPRTTCIVNPDDESQWVPLSCQEHEAFGLLIWKMESSSEHMDNQCQDRAQEVLHKLNTYDELVDNVRQLLDPKSNLDEVFAKIQALVGGENVVDTPKKPVFSVRRNSCDCHPETCCCDKWAIYQDEKKITTIFSKETARNIVESLNK